MGKFIESREASYIATNDLTGKQYYAVALDASNESQVILANAQTAPAIGILMTEGKAGDTVQVVLTQVGTMKAIFGGSISVGDKLTADSGGKLIATSTATDRIIGVAKHAASSGDIKEFICAFKP